MARFAIAVLFMTSACSLYYGDGKSGPPSTTADASAQSQAEQDFTNKVLPILELDCAGCHAGSQAASDFLTGSTPQAVLDSMLSSEPNVIDLVNPAQSMLVRTGPHAGPGFTPAQEAVIVAWLNEL